MILINERFTLKKDTWGWELHDTTKSDSPKSKSGTKTRVTFHPTIIMACEAVLDRCVDDECKTLRDAVDLMIETKGQIIKACGGTNKFSEEK